MDPSCQNLTRFITPMGRFCFKRLPFGITSAPENFQRLMGNLLKGLEGTAVVMDVILVYGADKEEHNQRLDTVLRTIKASTEQSATSDRLNYSFLGTSLALME